MICNLEVDVNGQETFFVNKEILALFSGKLHKLFTKSASEKRGSFKVIFNDFPGGAEGFELIVKFCYNGGIIDITSSNMFLLHFAAKFMEINEDQTKKYFENIYCSTWSELIDCLNHCQEWLSFMNSSHILQEILNILVEKISMPNTSSPITFSTSSIQFSGDTSTTYSSRCSGFQTTVNWIQDLELLNIELFEKVVKTMISNKLDHELISSFLLYYQKTKFPRLSPKEKCRFINIFISSSDESFKNIPFRSLSGMVQYLSYNFKIEKNCVRKLEKLIGSRLDEATVDDILIPSSSYAYDVNLMLKLSKIFLSENRRKEFFLKGLKKVGCLMDLYLAEVAPDPNLRPSKFLALAFALPDFARESHDRVYEATDLYFEVHKSVSLEEKIRICSALNYDKLSSKSLVHLSKNDKFPTCAAANALFRLQSKLSNPLENDENIVELRCNSSLCGNGDEQLLIHLWKGKQRRKEKKRSANEYVVRNSDVLLCPTYSKSFPRLCS